MRTWGLYFLREFLLNARCASSHLDLAIFNPICSARFTSFRSSDSVAVKGTGARWGFSVRVERASRSRARFNKALLVSVFFLFLRFFLSTRVFRPDHVWHAGAIVLMTCISLILGTNSFINRSLAKQKHTFSLKYLRPCCDSPRWRFYVRMVIGIWIIFTLTVVSLKSCVSKYD